MLVNITQIYVIQILYMNALAFKCTYIVTVLLHILMTVLLQEPSAVGVQPRETDPPQMQVNTRVCMHACMYVCMYVFIYVICMCVGECMCMYVCMYVRNVYM